LRLHLRIQGLSQPVAGKRKHPRTKARHRTAVGHDYQLHREQWIGRPREEVFEFFSDAANLQAITPPWLNFRILSPMAIAMRQGAEIRYRLAWHGIPVRWSTVIVDWHPPDSFVDWQAGGPYAFWEHTHSFLSEAGGTRIIDHVRYRLPLGFLGRIAHRLRVRADVERIFDYRAQVIARHFSGVPVTGQAC
jgi:ligand-binding SRPBCC domain-containing protein